MATIDGYQSDATWKQVQAFLPKKNRLSDETMPDEYHLPLLDMQVHIDHYRVDAPKATVLLLHGVGGNGRLLSFIAVRLREVTTDYLLKGIETEKAIEQKPDAHIFVVIATALHLFGCAMATFLWYDEQQAMDTFIGFLFLILGLMTYGIGMYVSDSATKAQAKRKFWAIDVWLVSFLPLSLLYNILFTGIPAPYPALVNPLHPYVLFWIIYTIGCMAVTITLSLKKKE